MKHWKTSSGVEVLDLESLPAALTEEEWLELRKHGLGATAVAAIAGVHAFKTPSDVYCEATGLTEPPEDNDFMWWGREEEPLVIKKFAVDTGKDVFRTGYRNFVMDGEPWARCTPDGLLVNECAGFEAKTTGLSQKHRWGEEWSDEVPEEYLCQCQWSMLVTGVPLWYLAVKIDRKLYKYILHEDKALQKELFDRAKDFWLNYVLARRLPPPDSSDSFRKMVERVYPEESKDLLLATEEHKELLQKHNDNKEAFDTAKAELDKTDNMIRLAIGSDYGIDFGDRGKVILPQYGGKPTPSWKDIANALKPYVPDEVWDKAVESNSKTKAAYRTLRFNTKEV